MRPADATGARVGVFSAARVATTGAPRASAGARGELRSEQTARGIVDTVVLVAEEAR